MDEQRSIQIITPNIHSGQLLAQGIVAQALKQVLSEKGRQGAPGHGKRSGRGTALRGVGPNVRDC